MRNTRKKAAGAADTNSMWEKRFFSLKDLFLATSKKKLSDGIYFIKQQNYVHIEQRKAIYSYLVFLRAYIET